MFATISLFRCAVHRRAMCKRTTVICRPSPAKTTARTRPAFVIRSSTTPSPCAKRGPIATATPPVPAAAPIATRAMLPANACAKVAVSPASPCVSCDTRMSQSDESRRTSASLRAARSPRERVCMHSDCESHIEDPGAVQGPPAHHPRSSGAIGGSLWQPIVTTAPWQRVHPCRGSAARFLHGGDGDIWQRMGVLRRVRWVPAQRRHIGSRLAGQCGG